MPGRGCNSLARGVWWREATAAEVDRVYAVRVLGTWRGCPVQLVGAQKSGPKDVTHIVYLGHDAPEAEGLGLVKSDAGVYEVVVPAAEVEDLREEQSYFELSASPR